MDINPDYLAKFNKKPITERQHYIEEITKITKRPFPQIAKLVQGWTIPMLRDSALEAQKAKNPPAYWFWYRNQTLK